MRLFLYIPPLQTFTCFSGTSDEHLSLIEHLRPVHSRLSAVIVTTPQAVALLDAMKCISFTRAAELPVLGLIENMSGYACPCCGEVTNVFSTGGGMEMAKQENVAFLGSLPVDAELVTLLDAARDGSKQELSNGDSNSGFELWERYSKTSSALLFRSVTDRVLGALPRTI